MTHDNDDNDDNKQEEHEQEKQNNGWNKDNSIEAKREQWETI